MAKDKKTNSDSQPQNGPSRGAYESYKNQDSISRRQENQPASPDSRTIAARTPPPPREGAARRNANRTALMVEPNMARI